MQSFLGLPNFSATLHVVPNTVPEPSFATDATCMDLNERNETGLRDSPLKIVFLSALYPTKGAEPLLKALVRLREEHPALAAQLRLVLVGHATAQMRSTLEQFIAEHELGAVASLAGPLYGEDKQRMLGSADVFVHPTMKDYFPLVILEAMRIGKAIVASDVGAIPEMLAHGEAGVLVPAGDEAALARSLADLLQDARARRCLGDRAKDRYQKCYSADAFEDGMRAVYLASGAAL